MVAAGSKFVNEALGRYLNDIAMAYSCLEIHRDQQAQSDWAQPLRPRWSETLSPHIGGPEPCTYRETGYRLHEIGRSADVTTSR